MKKYDLKQDKAIMKGKSSAVKKAFMKEDKVKDKAIMKKIVKKYGKTSKRKGDM